MLQPILSNELFETLKVINNVYEKSGHGCLTIEITTDRKDLQKLEMLGFIFRNSESGWYPSTNGQEYVRKFTTR